MASSALALVAGSGVTVVLAQDQDAPVLEEIVVTAQKREQALQDVPIAMTAFTSIMLQNAGVDDIKEIMNLSPSFQASTNTSETQGLVIRLRGIGTQGNNPAFESAVGVFIDGVYRSRSGSALSEILDIDRIEVLRGPQGTLFGRNTSAGALSIITRGPSFEPEGKGSVSYGRFNEFVIRGTASGPLVTDKVAARVSAFFRRRDGLIKDSLTGEDLDNKERYKLKGQLLFTPNDTSSLKIITDYRHQNEQCCYPVTIQNGIAASIINNVLMPGTQINPPAPFKRRATKTPDRPLTQNVNDWGVSAEFNQDLGSYSFTSITAFRNFKSFRQLDLDFTDADLINQDRNDQIKIFTQEARMQGVWGALDWLVGVFYSNEDIILRSTSTHGRQYENFLNTRIGPLLQAFTGANFTQLAFALGGVAPGTGWAAGTGAIDDHFRSDNTSLSLFTHNVFSLTEQLQLTLGFRVNFDNKRGRSALNNNPANTPGCTAIRPVLIGAIPNLSMQDIGFVGDSRRVKDLLAALGCLGIASPAFNYDLKQNNDEWNGIAGLSYKISDDVLTYISASRGYKAGGINLDRAGTILSQTGNNLDPRNFLDPRFKQEVVYSYEVGVKSTLADNRVTLNLALFYEDINNFQLNTFTGFNFTPENVEKAKTRGFELDLAAAPTEGLTVQGGVAFAKADYGKNITDLTNTLINQRGLRAGTQLLNTASPLAGRQLTNAPRWVVTSAFTYEKPIAGGALNGFVHFDLRYSSSFNTGSDLDIQKQQSSFIIANTRFGLISDNQGWQIDFWVKNLFDKNYFQVAFDIPLQANDGFGAFLADPRTFGVTARASF